MKTKRDISEEISEINERDPIKYAETVLKKLHPYAADYIISMREFGLIPESSSCGQNTSEKSLKEFKDDIAKLNQHLFADWLNKEPSFQKAKKLMINKLLIAKNIEDINSECVIDFLKQIALEFICANFIATCMNNKNLFNQIVVPDENVEKIRFSIKKLKNELSKCGGLAFKHESKQHLLQYLLEELLNDDNKNIYSSGKKHARIIRELFTKRIIQQLVGIFNEQGFTHNFAVDVATNIVCIFFDQEMKKSDAAEDAKEIMKNLIEEQEFLEKRVLDLIFKQQ